MRGVYSVRYKPDILLKMSITLDEYSIEYDSIATLIQNFSMFALGVLAPDTTVPADSEECLMILSEKLEIVGKMARIQKLKKTTYGPLKQTASRATPVMLENLSVGMANSDFAPLTNYSNFEQNLTQEDKGYGIEEILSQNQLTPDQLYPVQTQLSDLDDLLEQAIAEQEAEAARALLEKVTGGFSVNTNNTIEAQISQLKVISDKDPRLEKDKLYRILLGEADEAKLYALRVLYYNLPQEHWSTEKAEKMLADLLNSLK